MIETDLFCRTDRHRTIARRAQDLAQVFAQRAPAHDQAGTFPAENFADMRAAGHSLLTVPEEYGGEGGGVYDMVLAQSYLGRGDGSTALSIGWHISKIGQLIEVNSWEPEVVARICTGAVRHGYLLNAAASEPQMGSPSRGGRPTTTARRENGRWVINGRKNFTTLAPILHYFVILAAIEGTDANGWFLAERGTPGMTVIENWDTLGMRATGSHDLLLENVTLPDEALVEKFGKGVPSREAPGGGTGWNLHIPAVYLGIAEAARNFAVDFARGHKTTSTTSVIADLPNVQANLGQIELDLLAARTLIFSLAQRWDEDPEARPALMGPIGGAKVFITNTALAVVDRAMRVVGAVGLFRQHPLERYYRDVRAGLHNPPMEDGVIARMAQAALKENI